RASSTRNTFHKRCLPWPCALSLRTSTNQLAMPLCDAGGATDRSSMTVRRTSTPWSTVPYLAIVQSKRCPQAQCPAHPRKKPTDKTNMVNTAILVERISAGWKVDVGSAAHVDALGRSLNVAAPVLCAEDDKSFALKQIHLVVDL